MNNLFLPMQADEREAFFSVYLNFLKQRDGVPDRAKLTLSGREAFFEDLDRRPVRWSGPIDSGLFYQLLNKRPGNIDDPRLVWLLAAAKANRAERYAINEKLRLQNDMTRLGPQRAFIYLEEVYHTRILLDVCKVFGLEFEMSPPPFRTRVSVQAILRGPDIVATALSLCGEIVGSILFQLLWEKAVLFESQPDVLNRLRTLVGEILVDELGHVACCQAELGPRGIALARIIFPRMVSAYLGDLPEFAMLLGSRAELLRRIMTFDLRLSPDIERMAVPYRRSPDRLRLAS